MFTELMYLITLYIILTKSRTVEKKNKILKFD